MENRSHDNEQIRTLRIENELGLHARSAAKIVALANQFKADLYFKKEGQEVDGSSILSILTLACPRGTEIEVRTVGEESVALMEAVSELFKEKFGELK
ncbi:MAG: HPr family phosphocarrier protein [Deltaproteobacteria bacterium]|nr:HPr family phosphocarrier protein [Deltaproteobacteria bacterium]MBW2302232.1 HPr family phosphocarrier protein [Deltaproteobacteria bacterium]